MTDTAHATREACASGEGATLGELVRRWAPRVPPGFFLPPLTFTEDELEAVVLGLCYVHERGDALLGRAAAEAHAKIKAVLPREAREALDNPIALPGPPRSAASRSATRTSCSGPPSSARS